MSRLTGNLGWPRRPGTLGCVLAALALLSGVGWAVFSGGNPVHRGVGTSRVVGHVSGITVAATGLHPGGSDALTSNLRVTTSGRASDQLDAALAAGGTAVGVYHQRVSVGEIPDLASCDGEVPSPKVVDHWLHYGPLLVPGRTSGTAAPATATLTVPRAGLVAERGLAVTLYFAHAGPLTLDLPVARA